MKKSPNAPARFLWTFCFFILFMILTVPVLAATNKTGKLPNVVFILVDDMGYSDLGCYGSEIQTPNLDRLADKGLRFTQFYNTARCWPTRAALLTGYYAQQIRRDKLFDTKPGNRPKWAFLLPQLLSKHGYRNYHSGKWHIDGKILDGGFDRSLQTHGFFGSSGNKIDDKPAAYSGDVSNYYSTIAIVDFAVDCLKDHQANYSNQPFFQYIAFHAPHFPLHALPEDIERYRDRYRVGWDVLRQQRYARQREMGLVNTTLSQLEPDVGPPYSFPDAIKQFGPGEINRPLPWTDLTKEQQQFQATKMSIHAAMIDRVDQEIGRLIEQLKAMDAFNNTILFFASDNGASAEIMIRGEGHDPQAAPGSRYTHLCLGPGFSSAANTPFRRHKTWVHEGGISTPLVVHWPDGITAHGQLRHTPAHVVDFVPTILDITGIEKPAVWEGVPIPPAPGHSLVPAFERDVVIDRDLLWWMHDGHRAIRVGDWKLVAPKNEPWELYNLSTDRAEADNLVKMHPEKAKELESLWNTEAERFAAGQ